MIEAKVICDSIGPNSPRLFTIRCTYPKFIHSEVLRHRMMSHSVSSARAIPFKKLFDEVTNPASQAKPFIWGREQKGMSPGDALSNESSGLFFEREGMSEQEKAEEIWNKAIYFSSRMAELLSDLGVHKSIVNRLIEPGIHVHDLITATKPGWMNFFGLRLDKAADPTLRALAEEMWRAWNESEPQYLNPGEWHLPFCDVETTINVNKYMEPKKLLPKIEYMEEARKILIKISVARCARLSYDSFETKKRSTIEEDLKLYDRLVGSVPLHSSPSEHQATSDSQDLAPKGFRTALKWRHPELHGNLPGWQQYRKMLPGESLAPLPEGYTS